MVYGATDAEYIVSVNSNAQTIRLVSGIPATSWTSQNTYKYFQVTMPLYLGALTVTVTPFNGDPDLYMSISTQEPTNQDYDWVSMAYGADHLTVDYTMDNFQTGEYYIGVYGWTNTSFTITAMITDLSEVDTTPGQMTTLFDGVPQTGLLTASSDMHYYTFFLGDEGNLTVTVTPQYGDPDLYITTDGTIPSPDNYQWDSLYYGRDSIIISDGCNNCQYTIGVNAFSHTLYTIIASSTSSANILQSGHPQSGFVQSQDWQYYRFYAGITGLPMTVALNALTGDPDLYMSTTVTRPDHDNYDWVAQAVGSDVLTVQSPLIGWYYIGVYGWQTSSFTLTVTLGDIVLVAGQPYADVLQEDNTRRYVFTLPPDVNNQGFSVLTSLQFLYGESAVYITTSADQAVGPDFYMWASTNVNPLDLRNTLTISADDPNACDGCTYYMAVNARTTSSYSVTVSFGGMNVLLSAGRAVEAYLDTGLVDYYYGFVDDDSFDVSVDITTYLGVVALYISTTNPNPGPGDYDWKDESTGSLHVTIATDDHDFTVGTYFIGVVASVHSRYSIVMSTASRQVSDGTPAHGQIPSAGVNYYFFYHEDDSDLRIDLSRVASSPNSNGPFQVWVTTSANGDTSQPSAEDHLWYKFLAFGQHMVFLANDPNFCSECTYFIAVSGVIGDEYELRVTGTGDFAVLVNEHYVYGVVSHQEYMYYETFVDVAANFTVSLESCTGNADLYMSQATYQPSRLSYTWRSENVDANDLVTVNDLSLTQTGFYIGVHGEPQDTNSEFRLTVHSRSDTQFGADFPVPGNAGDLLVLFRNGGIEVTFTNAVSPINSELTYQAFFSRDDSGIVMYSRCGLDYAWNSGDPVSGSGSGKTSIFLHGESHAIHKDTAYRVNVAVMDAAGNHAVYQWSPVTTSEGDGEVSSAWVLIGAICLILLMIAVCVLVVKNRRLTQELDVEMGGIPKAVVRKAARGPRPRGPDGKERPKGAINYAQLLEEVDDEGDYEPPDMAGMPMDI
jgi:hypothetical protein